MLDKSRDAPRLYSRKEPNDTQDDSIQDHKTSLAGKMAPAYLSLKIADEEYEFPVLFDRIYLVFERYQRIRIICRSGRNLLILWIAMRHAS